MLAPKSPGPVIRELRLARRLSQEELASRAEISPRHLSCLETGRARPSHAMLLVLGTALDLPLRVRNALLVAGGFAPAFATSALDDPEMTHVHHAVQRLLRVHEPHPALLLDRHWNVLRWNDGARRLFGWCGLRPPAERLPNAMKCLFDRALGVRDCIVNFDLIADEALARLRTEAQIDAELRALVDELERLRGPSARPAAPRDTLAVALPLHLRRGAVELRYFTTLTTLGTPLDVNAQELRLEGYFAMDEATEAFGAELAAASRP